MMRWLSLAPAALAASLSITGCDPAPATSANDFATLAQEAPGYAVARPDTVLGFPRDHGPHEDFRIEWWYLTANLEDGAGNPYGAQWTLFRLAIAPPGEDLPATPWQSRQVYMAHVAITTPDDHRSFQRYARGGRHGGVARAGVSARPFAAWLDDWTLRSSGPGWLPLELAAQAGDHAIELVLAGDRGPLLQGSNGFSAKHPDGAGSHYYSQPFLQASGKLVVAGREIRVSGPAWLDREWSSQFLQPEQAGWDWFAVHLDSGEKLMLFRLRARTDATTGGDYRHGVLIAPDGARQVLEPAAIQFEVLGTERVAGRLLPMRWRIGLPQIGRELRLEALHPGQWMAVDFPYWEGVILARGTTPGSSGRGYMELTGYPAE